MKKSSIIFISVITTIVTLIVVLIGFLFIQKVKLQQNKNNLNEQSTLENKETDKSVNNEEEKEYIENYEVSGYLKIPKIEMDIPILSEVTVHSLKVSAAILYGDGLNEIGNTTIIGLNDKGDAFENIHKLEIGDEIVVINQKKQEFIYEVYDKKTVKSEDAEYMTRDTNNRCEITLNTNNCNDTKNNRLIILAREKE